MTSGDTGQNSPSPSAWQRRQEAARSAPVWRRGDDEVRKLAGMRLLVVEDDPGMAALLVRSLQREGYAVDAVDNGEDALWSVLEADYDSRCAGACAPRAAGRRCSC